MIVTRRRESYSRSSRAYRSGSKDSKTGSDRWLVSYADFITLLFGFFLVMYSVSQVNDSKYESLSQSLAQIFLNGGDGNIDNLVSLLPGVEKGLDSPTLNSSNLDRDNELSAATELLAHEINKQLVGALGEHNMAIDYRDSSLEITLDSNTLFASGRAALSADADEALKGIAKLLKTVPGSIQVEGHTDNIPINSQQFSNNWELSSARAVAVVQRLIVNGIEPNQLSAVGYGEYQPVGDNTVAEGREQNRRVVLNINMADIKEQEHASDEFSQEDAFDRGFRELIGTKPASTNVSGAEGVRSDENLPLVESVEQKSKAVNTNGNVSLPATVPPVELKNGGLLFTSDPDLPRNNYQ